MAASDPTGGRPVDPSRGALRPLGLAEARITAGFWADRQRVISEGSLDHARAWMDKVGWTGNFTIGAGHRARRAPGPGVRRLRGLQADRGDVVGDRPPARPGAGPRDRRAGRADRRSAGGRRLPQHGVRPPGPAAAVERPAVGPRALLRRSPAAGRGGQHPGARPRPAARHRAAGSPTTSASPSAPTAATESAVTRRSSPRWSSCTGSPASAATSTRPRCSCDRRGHQSLPPHQFGCVLLQRRHPGPRGHRAAWTRRPRALSGLRRGRRGRRDRRRRAAPDGRRAVRPHAGPGGPT